MNAFVELPDAAGAVVLSLFFAAHTGLLFLIIVRRMRLCRAPACLVPALLLLVAGLDLILLLEVYRALHLLRAASPAGQWAGGLPFLLHALLLSASGAYGAWGLWWEKRTAPTRITPDSIREALDNLPSGLCFSDLSGMPLLTNRQMYRLAADLTGYLFRNAQELWRELAAFDGQNGAARVQTGPSPVFRLPDGGVWRFIKTELTLDGKRYIQTTAADVTKLYTLSEELRQSNAALDEQHKRLKSLLMEIVTIRREEEILASKANIHDELGRCVLAGRRALAQEHGGGEIAPALALWREAAEKLESSLGDADGAKDDTLGQLTDAASALGCAIEWDGALPEDEDAAYLLLSAVREAVTNAVRHAGADRVAVRLVEGSGAIRVGITDNGTARPDALTEAGGLKNLRRRVERAGGGMEITCGQGVRLRLDLPLKAKEE